jgi:hypothetical protein
MKITVETQNGRRIHTTTALLVAAFTQRANDCATANEVMYIGEAGFAKLEALHAEARAALIPVITPTPPTPEVVRPTTSLVPALPGEEVRRILSFQHPRMNKWGMWINRFSGKTRIATIAETTEGFYLRPVFPCEALTNRVYYGTLGEAVIEARKQYVRHLLEEQTVKANEGRAFYCVNSPGVSFSSQPVGDRLALRVYRVNPERADENPLWEGLILKARYDGIVDCVRSMVKNKATNSEIASVLNVLQTY